MSLENSLLGQENNIIFETKERSVAEKEQALSNYCAQKNNPISFVRQGEEKKDDVELAKDWQQVEEVWRDVLEEILKQAELFLRSPIFTDSFHKDHGSRRDWEANYIDNGLDAEIADYYKTNRLNSTLSIVPLLNFESACEAIENSNYLPEQLKSQARVILNKLSSEFPDNLHEYCNLSDKEKCQVVEKIEPIFHELVKLLSEQ